jgi:hypothetical protein
MIPVQLDQIQLVHLQRLIDGQVREGRTIEYKREFPTGRDKDKVHFLKAVTSLANSGGGDVVYGMDAKDGVPTAVCGFALDGTHDERQLALENFMRDGVQPRLAGVGFQWIDVEEGKSALVVRVKGSWNAPHRVIVENHNHFYGRNSVGAYPMDVPELRAAFVLSDAVGRRVEEFRGERLMRIEAGRTPVQLEPHAVVVLHVLPVGAFTGFGGQLLQANKDLARRFSLIAGHGSCPDVNLDGAVHFERRSVANKQYTQVFRNGCLEMVSTLPPYYRDELRISGDWLVRNIIESLTANLRQLMALNVGEPFVVSLAFLGVENYSLETHNELSRDHGIAEKNQRFVLPDVLVDSPDWHVQSGLRRVFDMLWNVYGFEACTTYLDDGSIRPVR